MYSNVTGFSHIVTTIEPSQEIASISDNEYGGGNTVYGHNVALVSDCQACDNINVSYCYFLDEMAVFCKNLHSRSFIAAIAHNKLAAVSHDCDFSWKP